MSGLDRITRNIAVMGGKPCVRGMRVTVGMIVGLVASGHTFSEILAAYPKTAEVMWVQVSPPQRKPSTQPWISRWSGSSGLMVEL